MTELYRRTLHELFSVDEAVFGYDAAALDEAEVTLGRSLPAVLREHYGTLGKHAFNRAHDRLLAPTSLRVAHDMLIFYEENQEVFSWGVPMSDHSADPPVQQSSDDSGGDWMPDHDHLSQFLFTMLFHHRVRMQPCVHGRAPRAALSSLEPHALELPGRRRPLASFYRVDGVVVEIDDFNEEGGVRVLAGSRDERALRAFQRASTIDWT